jgi:hypothetical protein
MVDICPITAMPLGIAYGFWVSKDTFIQSWAWKLKVIW